MKNIVIFMDCHCKEIYKYLCMNEFCKKEYNCSFISLNSYVVFGSKYINNTCLDNNDIEQIKKLIYLFYKLLKKIEVI